MSDTQTGQGTQETSAAEKRARLARLLQEKARGATTPAAGGETPAARATDHPLSPAQQRLWFLDRLLPAGPLYNLAALVRLRGPLDVGRLDAALTEIARRHETLRTTFHLHAGRPVQRVHAEPVGRLEVVDLATVPADSREADARRLARRAAREPFDLASGPLFRAMLLRLGEREHALLLTMHHIIADGWSVGVALRELVTLYASGDPARRSPLPELPVQYADFTHWQLEQLETSEAAAGLAYWTERLADLPTLALPTDRPRGAVQSVAGARRPIEIGPEVTDALKRLGRRHGATLFMTLLAAFQAWLSRYSGQTDFAVGSPVAGRPRRELEGLIGCFVNVLPLRGDLSGDPTFEAHLRQTRQTTLDAFARQDVPLERVVDALGLARDPGRSPLFQTLFVLQNAPLPNLALPGLDVEARELETGTAKFDLTLSLAETGGGLSGCLEYATALFDEPTAERMARNFLRLLHAIAEDPSRRLSELPMTGPDEARMLAWLNETAADFPRDVSIDELIAAQAAAHPDALALQEGERRLTYAELLAAAAGITERLWEAGIGPGHVVGIALPRGIDAIAAMLGVMQSGAAYLPLDPRQPVPRLLGMLDDARAAALVIADDDRDTFADFAGVVLKASGG
jgi:hypothetical protein